MLSSYTTAVTCHLCVHHKTDQMQVPYLRGKKYKPQWGVSNEESNDKKKCCIVHLVFILGFWHSGSQTAGVFWVFEFIFNSLKYYHRLDELKKNGAWVAFWFWESSVSGANAFTNWVIPLKPLHWQLHFNMALKGINMEMIVLSTFVIHTNVVWPYQSYVMKRLEIGCFCMTSRLD